MKPNNSPLATGKIFKARSFVQCSGNTPVCGYRCNVEKGRLT